MCVQPIWAHRSLEGTEGMLLFAKLRSYARHGYKKDFQWEKTISDKHRCEELQPNPDYFHLRERIPWENQRDKFLALKKKKTLSLTPITSN